MILTGGSTPNNLDNQYTRPEEWRLLISSSTGNGMFGFTGPDYGGPYPDPTRKSAVYYRGMRTKRPVNIENIQTTTASQNYGNFTSNLEVVSTTGKLTNNLYFVDNSAQTNYLPQSVIDSLPQTTNPMTLVGQAPFVSGNVFGVYQNNRQPDTTALNVITPVTAVAATGSLSVYGINYVTDGNFWRLAGSTVYGTDFAFEIDNNASSTYYAVVPTGSDDLFWDSIDTRLSTQFTTNATRVSASYTGKMIQVTAKGTKVSASAPASGLVDNRPAPVGYTVGMYIDMSSSIGASSGNDAYIYYITSTSGSSRSRAAWIDNNAGELKIKEWGFDGGGNKDKTWSWNSFHANYSSSMIHFAATRINDSITTPPDVYVNGISIGAPNNTLGTTSPTYTGSAPDGTLVMFSDTNGAASNNYLGYMDQFVYFRRNFSSGEITELYNEGILLNPLGHSQAGSLAVWYSFDSFSAGDGNLITADYGSMNLTQSTSNFSSATTTVPSSKSYVVFALTGSTSHGSSGNVTPAISGASIFNTGALAGGVTGVTGDVRYANDIVIPRITGSSTRTVISSRFSAPGGPEIQSYGYLDAYSHEYSAYNHLVFRNYTVRYIAGGKASANEIGLISESGGDGDPLQTLFTRPSGKFGNYNTASSVPELTYLTNPSYFKQQRNTNRRIQSGSTLLSPTFVVGYDNMSIASPIPRSDFQYTWITGTLANDYSYKSGKQRVFGYSPKSGILSSSVIIDGDSGFVPAITFPTASGIFGE